MYDNTIIIQVTIHNNIWPKKSDRFFFDEIMKL